MPFGPLGPSRLGQERGAQVVLGHGPVLRQLLARVNFQGASVGADRLDQKLHAFCPLGPSRLVPERVTQVVLGQWPSPAAAARACKLPRHFGRR